MIQLPSASDPEVSVIVLLDGAAEMAERALRAIAAGEPGVACETLILLNDPDEELESLVRRSTSGGRVIACRANAGPGVGWNLGTAIARAPRIATLHEDSEPQPGWLWPLCEAMDESGAGTVGSRLLNADGSVQNCGWVMFSDASHWVLNEATAPEVVAATEPTPADMVSGAAMLVDREAVRAAGGWDERFHPAVFMDIDVSTSIWNQGRLVLSVPGSQVVHASGAFDRRPNSPLTGPRLRPFLFERNRDRFLEKWPSVRDLAPPPTAIEPEPIKEAVQAALPHTRARTERARQGGLPPANPAARAERLFTGVEAPVVDDGKGGYEVAAEVESTLRSAERDLVDGYLRWLIVREEKVSDHIEMLNELLADRDADIAMLNPLVESLREENQRLSTTLDEVLNSSTWRLRTRLARLTGRS